MIYFVFEISIVANAALIVTSNPPKLTSLGLTSMGRSKLAIWEAPNLGDVRVAVLILVLLRNRLQLVRESCPLTTFWSEST